MSAGHLGTFLLIPRRCICFVSTASPKLFTWQWELTQGATSRWCLKTLQRGLLFHPWHPCLLLCTAVHTYFGISAFRTCLDFQSEVLLWKIQTPIHLIHVYMSFIQKSSQKRKSKPDLSLPFEMEHYWSHFIVAFSITLMWVALLYMCCFYWLMNKAVLANGLAE